MAPRILLVLALALAGTFPFGTSHGFADDVDALHPAVMVLKTGLGELSIRLDWANAPENAAAFMRYVREGVYANTSFDAMDEHCLYGGKPSVPLPGVAPNGNMIAAAGPPGEFKLLNRKGAVGFRRTAGSCNPSKRSNCTQIYIMLTDNPKADGDFSIFGSIQAEPAILDGIKARVLGGEPVPFKVEPSGD